MTPSSAARPWVARFVADVVRVRAYADFDDGTTREILNVGRRRAGVSGPVRYVVSIDVYDVPRVVPTVLTYSDPEPGIGTAVRDAHGVEWILGSYGRWVNMLDPYVDPAPWATVAGDYGPVTVVYVPRETSEEGEGR